MAMMAKMRSLAPAFILTVGVLFVLFMIISDSNVLEALGGRTNNIGSVNGQDITYQEFQQALEQQREVQKNQTGQDLTEDQIDQLNEQVWDALVTQVLFQQMIDNYGLKVTDEEVTSIILGDDPPAFLKQNFIDSLGSFNRALYEDALFNPQNKEALVQAEEMVRQSRLREKMLSVISASVTVGEDEVKRKFVDQNINVNAEYVLFDLAAIKDTDIKVTDDDIEAYYEKNIKNYNVQAQRKLKYILFPNQPSAEDSQQVKRGLESVLTKMVDDTIDFKELVEIYSELPYSKDTSAVNVLDPAVVEALNNAQVGSVVGPIETNQGYTLIKYHGTVASSEVTARASHILINQFGSEEKNLEEANKIYNELKAGVNFQSTAKEKSMDPGSAQKGGDLGYFGKGMMVKEFEDAVFSGKVGEVQKPVKTSFGYHIIKVTDRVSKKYVVEKIVNPVKQSASTRDKMYNAANDFSYLAKKNGFDKEAGLVTYKVQETPFFVKTGTIPGLGANKRLIEFSFENSVNTIGDPFKVFNGYIVVQIAESKSEQFKPLEEVKEQIRPIVLKEKKYQKLIGKVNNVHKKINGDLNKAPQVDAGLQVLTTGSFTPLSIVPNVGRDYAFISASMKLPLKKVSEPVKGLKGYYLLRVIERTDFDSEAYKTQSTNIRATLIQEKKSRFLNQWVEKLKENAEIVDNRYLFFGQ